MQYEDTPERPQCGADTTAFLSDVYNRSTRAQKRLVDVPQSGRSMIEMLGVLAIIGVLSVGGIAGYTKAMRIYRSNMQKQQISELVAAMLQIQPSLNFKDPYTNITFAFDALDLIPQGLTYKSYRLYDASGNYMSIYYGFNGALTQYGIVVHLTHSSGKLLQAADDYCQNAIQFAKENANVIKRVNLNKNSSSGGANHIFYGNAGCLENRKCLKDMSVAQIHQACQTFCGKNSDCLVSIFLHPHSPDGNY